MRRVMTQMNATRTVATLMVASDGSASASTSMTSASASASMTSTGSGFAFLLADEGSGDPISFRFAGGEGAPLPVLSVAESDLGGAPGGVLSSGFITSFDGEEKEEEEEEVCSVTLPPWNVWIRALNIVVVVLCSCGVVWCGVVRCGCCCCCCCWLRVYVCVCVCLFV